MREETHANPFNRDLVLPLDALFESVESLPLEDSLWVFPILKQQLPRAHHSEYHLSSLLFLPGVKCQLQTHSSAWMIINVIFHTFLNEYQLSYYIEMTQFGVVPLNG